MNLFGKAKTAKASPKDAIVRLRETLEMLEKREKYLETKIGNELKFAKANAQKNRRGALHCHPTNRTNQQAALMALKRKKAYENEITKISGSRMTIETQVMAIENANVNLETMNAMKAGAEAMKNIHGNLYVHSICY